MTNTTTAVAAGTPEWTLGDRLAKARGTAGLTQEELADRLGVSKKTVVRYEHDMGSNLHMVEQWAAVCGVDRGWVLGVTQRSAADSADGRVLVIA